MSESEITLNLPENIWCKHRENGFDFMIGDTHTVSVDVLSGEIVPIAGASTVKAKISEGNVSWQITVKEMT